MLDKQLQIDRLSKLDNIPSNAIKALEPLKDLGYIPISISNSGLITAFKPGEGNGDFNGTIAFFSSDVTDTGLFVPLDSQGVLFKVLVHKELWGSLDNLSLMSSAYEVDTLIGQNINMTDEETIASNNRLLKIKKDMRLIESELNQGFKYALSSSLPIPSNDDKKKAFLTTVGLIKDITHGVVIKTIAFHYKEDNKGILSDIEEHGVQSVIIPVETIRNLISCWASYEEFRNDEGYVSPEKREELGIFTELEEWLSDVTKMQPARFVEEMEAADGEDPVKTLSTDGIIASYKTGLFKQGILNTYFEYIKELELEDNLSSLELFLLGLKEAYTEKAKPVLENLAEEAGVATEPLN